MDADLAPEEASFGLRALTNAFDIMAGCKEAAHERGEKVRKEEITVANLKNSTHARSPPVRGHSTWNSIRNKLP
jgi:hypothetical protein